jgi:hypothetical protein
MKTSPVAAPNFKRAALGRLFCFLMLYQAVSYSLSTITSLNISKLFRLVLKNPLKETLIYYGHPELPLQTVFKMIETKLYNNMTEKF